MNQLQKVEKIEYTGHYSIFDKEGKKICDVATIDDALMMCSFDNTRTYRQVKILMDQIVNIPSTRLEDDKQLKAQNILPDRQAIPVVV
jgi:hypothetical protein